MSGFDFVPRCNRLEWSTKCLIFPSKKLLHLPFYIVLDSRNSSPKKTRQRRDKNSNIIGKSRSRNTRKNNDHFEFLKPP